VTEASGASVIVPAGALTTNTTIRIARDSTGAPAIPADLTSAGSTYVITPHGGEFAEGVEVQLPLPNVTLTPYQEFKIAKAQPGGPWVVLEDTVVNDASISAKVDSFSYFVVVTVTYLIPIAQLPPLQMSSSLACTGGRCTGLIGGTTATYTVTGNGGQAPTHCLDPSYSIGTTSNGSSVNWQVSGTPIPPTGGTVTRTLSPFPGSANYKFIVARKCSVGALYGELSSSLTRNVTWAPWNYGVGLGVVRSPGQVNVVEGLVANVDVVLTGGASVQSSDANSVYYAVPTRTDRAIIDWERSDDSGASWKVVARSYQD